MWCGGCHSHGIGWAIDVGRGWDGIMVVAVTAVMVEINVDSCP